MPEPGENYKSFTSDGAWCWFSDPRAICYKGKYNRIYAGWIDHDGNVTVGSYDLDSHEIKTHVIHSGLQEDDHDAPALFITNEGKIMVFYSKHADSTPINLVVSENPEDISRWQQRRELYLNDTITYQGYLNSYTYANVCRLSEENNKFYLFWRGMDFKPNFSTSSDGGKTWTKGKILILPDRTYKNRRPYLKLSSDNKGRIDFAFTDGHPRNEPQNSIYYMQYHDGAFFKANGDKIKDFGELPIEPGETDKVYDASLTGEKAWIWDVAEDKSGYPVMVYVRFHGDSTHVYYYARWDGKAWINSRMVDSGGWFPQTPSGTEEREPNYSGGLVLDHENPEIVYASVRRNGVFEIEKWVTSDGGHSWKIIPITQQSKHDNVRPFAIRNMSKDNRPQVLWMNIERYIHYTDYNSVIRMEIN